MSITMTIKYEAGHSYSERWDKTDLYCPHCGKQSIWHEESEGDYYVGEEHLCIDCHYNFTIQGPFEKTWQSMQRIEQLMVAR